MSTETVEVKQKSKKAAVVDTPQGAVIYTDGGCRPSKGFGGWGFHGYIYSDQEAKKGTGNPRQYLTQDGYIAKSGTLEKPLEVKPLYYLDGYGSFSNEVTNNIAEITAASKVTEYLCKYDLKNVNILTDSEQVVKASSNWINLWKSNNWIKSDGMPVANREHWELLDKNIKALEQKGTVVKFKWVQGHMGHDGNERADQYATMGVLNSKDGYYKNEIDEKDADGYWSFTHDRNHFITHKCIYFISRQETIVPGEYYMGNHGRDDELLAKRAADGCYAYVRVKDPDPVIEMARLKQVKVCQGNENIFILKLNKLFSREVYNDMMSFGDVCLYKKNTNPNQRGYLNLYYIDKEVVTEQLNPPLIAIRAIESVNVLKGLLLSWEQGDDKNICSTDVTDYFYEPDEKKTNRLKKEFSAGFNGIKVEVTNFTGKSEVVEICLGIDAPARNALKRVEKDSPIVTVITWKESAEMYRYATVVKTKDDIGIWAGMYSNYRLLSV
jgi:ribonuclease HI